MDEKTRVIPTNANQNVSPNKPGIPPSSPANKPSFVAGVNPASNIFQPGEKGTIQKKRIITGIVAGGSLLGAAVLATSFISPHPQDPPPDLPGQAGKAGGINPVGGSSQSGSAPKVVSLTTDHPVNDVVVDDLSLEDAREVARAEIGTSGIFCHQGQLYSTATEDEIASLSPEEKAEYLKGIVTHDITGETVNIDGREMEVKIAGMHDFGKLVYHDDGSYIWYDINGNSTVMENVSENEFHELIRTDPVTGEETPFIPSLTLKHIDQGVIDVSLYPSNVEIQDNGEVIWSGSDIPAQPIDTATYLIGDGVAGWDLDADGTIDVVDDNYSFSNVDQTDLQVEDRQDMQNDQNLYQPDSKSDRELALEKANELAQESGIDVRKVKVHETDDGGFDYKIKGDDGKIKGHFTLEELRSSDHSQNDNSQSTDDNSSNTDTFTGSMQPDMNTVNSEAENDYKHDDNFQTQTPEPFHDSHHENLSPFSSDDSITQASTYNDDLNANMHQG